MAYTFINCKSIKTLELSSLDTRNVKSMEFMFYFCFSLGALDLSSFDTRNVKNLKDMFKGCSSLKEVKFQKASQSREKILEQLQMDNIHCKTT